jgi:hypothetical protein
MIKSLSAPATILLLTIGVMGVPTRANASEQAPPPAEKSNIARAQNTDCSQQVWPHISASCLRNADSKIEVRLVTATRR